ncbi:HAMP domain-containing sensor histidine kinase [Sporosarcina sp. Te-1]|uniref:sensor histidine kinase n=1 Tax=Sporosarcina sp. Te-1 TaxID=2818390 RepID=UPI001A9D512D|nr:sensor histidine kinase [Sporosarcina sp. Te-1]QTD40047.1 sensor histidine kinase [Sporosarcina sp. Te-1]
MSSIARPTRREEIMQMAVIALLTAFASEIKVIPFNGELFRFGLGSIAFFLYVLIRPPRLLIQTGILTGVVVVLLRVSGDGLFGDLVFAESMREHLPAFAFYVIYATGLHLLNVKSQQTTPLLVGALAAFIELTGNTTEHLIRSVWVAHYEFGVQEWSLLIGVAIIRNYFAIGLYSAVIVNEQKKRIQEMMELSSGLYTETLYIEKSMKHIEQVTLASHDLYRKLKSDGLLEYSRQALSIAQEIHEVKKDAQRVLTGLTKLNRPDSRNMYRLSELLGFVVTANETYAEYLHKQVSFHVDVSMDMETESATALLALINNVVANAVEALLSEGRIDISTDGEDGRLIILVRDTGKGIPEDLLPIIFEPGFTTKYNEQGVAATGIGLSHVKDIVKSLEGTMEVRSNGQGTVFTIALPCKNIQKRVE